MKVKIKMLIGILVSLLTVTAYFSYANANSTQYTKIQLSDSSTDNNLYANTNATAKDLFLYYTIQGGFLPKDISISYNSSTNKIIKNDNILRVITERTLSENEEKDLSQLILDVNFFNASVNDIKPCPDCFQYGLNITMGDMTNEVHWNDRTMIDGDVKGLYVIAFHIEKLAEAIDNNTKAISQGVPEPI
jgi:hypothetical protein